MRAITWGLILALGACGGDGGGDVTPTLIPGGGVADGPIDGEVNVFVVEQDTDAPIAGASVRVGALTGTTNAEGLIELQGELSGPQDVEVAATGYRGGMWGGVAGANVTLALRPLEEEVGSATLSGTIDGFDTLPVPAGHALVAVVGYAQAPELGDPGNELSTPANGNVCFAVAAGSPCSWSVVSRTGAVALLATIIDRDGNGTPANPDDDISTVIGYAYKRGLTVADGIDQSGIVLERIEAGNLVDAVVDFGSPPAALTEVLGILGVDLGAEGIVQVAAPFVPDAATVLAPALGEFAGSTYRFLALAQMGDANSAVVRKGLSDPAAIAAGTWLVPPTGLTATPTSITFTPTAGAQLHTLELSGASGVVAELILLDGRTTAALDPAFLGLASGELQVRVNAIAAGATIDPADFEVEAITDALSALAGDETTVTLP